MDEEGFWRARLERWERSGLTSKAFAAKEGCPVGALSTWKRRLRTATAGSVLLPVKVGPTAPFFEVIVDGRLTVRVPTDFDEAALARLLHALGAAR